MLFKVGDEIIDTDKVPVALIFKTKEEGKIVGNIISNIKDDDTEFPVEIDGLTNGNWRMMFPAGVSKREKDAWSTLSKEEAELLDKTPCITPNIDFEL